MSKKILIVDDEPDLLNLLKARLEDVQYNVITASDGKSALEIAKNEKPDLIIVDVLMPVMTGYQFVEQLKKIRDGGTAIPIIVISARPAMEQFFDRWDIHCFLPKPFKEDILMSKVTEALGSSDYLAKKTQKGVTFGAPPPPPSAPTGKRVVLIAVEEYVLRKLKNFLELKGYSVEVAINEKDTVSTAHRLHPDFVFAQFWEDFSVINTPVIAKELAMSKETKDIPFAVFSSAKVSLEALKEFSSKLILSYEHTDELVDKMLHFIERQSRIEAKKTS